MGLAAYLCYFLALFELIVWSVDFPPYFNRGSWKFYKEGENGEITAADISRNVFFVLAMVNSLPLLFAGICEQRKSKWLMVLFAGLLGFFVFQQTYVVNGAYWLLTLPHLMMQQSDLVGSLFHGKRALVRFTCGTWGVSIQHRPATQNTASMEGIFPYITSTIQNQSQPLCFVAWMGMCPRHRAHDSVWSVLAHVDIVLGIVDICLDEEESIHNHAHYHYTWRYRRNSQGKQRCERNANRRPNNQRIETSNNQIRRIKDEKRQDHRRRIEWA